LQSEQTSYAAAQTVKFNNMSSQLQNLKVSMITAGFPAAPVRVSPATDNYTSTTNAFDLTYSSPAGTTLAYTYNGSGGAMTTDTPVALTGTANVALPWEVTATKTSSTFTSKATGSFTWTPVASAPTGLSSATPAPTATTFTPTWTAGDYATSHTLKYALSAGTYGTATTWTSGIAVTSLTASTGYKWQACGVNTYGETCSADQTVTTASDVTYPAIANATYSAIAPAGYSYSAEETTRYGTYKYNTLAAWETARKRNITGEAGPAVVDILGDWTGVTDTGTTITSTWVTNATNYLLIRALGTARHTGMWDATKYNLNYSVANTTGTIDARTAFLVLDGLQLKRTTPAAGGYPVISTGNLPANATLTVKNSIIRSDPTVTDCSGILMSNATLTLIAYNNIFYDYGTGSDIIAQNSGTALYAYNNTFIGGRFGINSSQPYMKNNVAMDQTNKSYNITASSANCSYNAGNVNTIPGTSNVSGGTSAGYFVDPTNKNYLLKSGANALVGAGADTGATVTTGIRGNTRSLPYDIGADQR
jgi:hypothetical protein